MERPRASTIGWGVLISSVAAYEYFAPDGELLSERFDSGLEGRYKALWFGGAVITAAHLVNTFERLGVEQYDPFPAVLGKVRRKAKGID